MLTVPLPLIIETLPKQVSAPMLSALEPLWEHPSILAVSVRLAIGDPNTCDHWVLPLTLLVDHNGRTRPLTNPADVQAIGGITTLAALGTLQFALGQIHRTFGSIWGQYEHLVGGEVLEVLFMPQGMGMRSGYNLAAAQAGIDAYTTYAEHEAHDPALLQEAIQTADDNSFYPLTGVLLLPSATSAHATLAHHTQRHAMIARWERLVFYDGTPPFPFSLQPNKA